ncbi:MAG: tetratricopeptide repeat protein [Deltaproteobacteria bacterium]
MRFKKKSLKEFAQLIFSNPDQLLKLADQQTSKGNLDQAIELYKKVIDFGPLSSDPLNKLASLINDIDEKIHWYQQAIRLDNSDVSYRELIKLFLSREDIPRARNTLDLLKQRISPEDIQLKELETLVSHSETQNRIKTLQKEAVLKELEGNKTAAISALEEALNQSPENCELLISLIKLVDCKDYQLNLLERLVTINPVPHHYFSLMRTLIELNQLEKADYYLREFIASRTQFSEVEDTDTKNQIAALRQEIHIKKSSSRLVEIVSQVIALTNSKTEDHTLELCAEALEISLPQGTTFHQLATLIDDPETKIKLFQKAISIDHHLWSYLGAIQLFLEQDKFELAEELLGKLTESYPTPAWSLTH